MQPAWPQRETRLLKLTSVSSYSSIPNVGYVDMVMGLGRKSKFEACLCIFGPVFFLSAHVAQVLRNL